MRTASDQAPRGGFRQALGFLTILGRDGGTPTPSSFCWFPLVGASIGGLLGFAWWALSLAFPMIVVAVLVVAGDLAVTGMLHFDGLVDSADGLLPHLSRDRRLQVMAEPQLGAFGLGAGALVLVARVTALATIGGRSWWQSLLLLAGIWTVSRSVMVISTTKMRYLRASGIASAFISGAEDRPYGSVAPILGVVAGAGALMAWRLVGGACVLAACLAGSGLVLVLAKRRLGGFTGDVLGAAGVIGETLGLLVAAAKW